MNDKVTKLLAAATAVVDRWETPLWKDVPATAHYIYALRDAIKETEKQEPMLSIERLDQWVDASLRNKLTQYTRLRKKLTQHTQPEWVGLTDEEAAECWSTSAVQTWKNIETKLKEKNT